MTAMLWFRIDRAIVDSHKLVELEERIGPAALAHVVKLLCGVAAHRASGDLTGLSDAVLERWAHWTGERGALVQALRETRWLDAEGVHGWRERQAAIAAKFERDRIRPDARKRRTDEPGADSADSARIPRGIRTESARDKTIQNKTEQKDTQSARARPPSGHTEPVPRQADAPQTLDEYLKSPSVQRTRRSFPHLDGKNGRPHFDDVVRAIGWINIVRWQWPTTSLSKLATYVAKQGAAHRFAWEREQGRGQPERDIDEDELLKGMRPPAKEDMW